MAGDCSGPARTDFGSHNPFLSRDLCFDQIALELSTLSFPMDSPLGCPLHPASNQGRQEQVRPGPTPTDLR
jgi:hypothetical protein